MARAWLNGGLRFAASHNPSPSRHPISTARRQRARHAAQGNRRPLNARAIRAARDVPTVSAGASSYVLRSLPNLAGVARVPCSASLRPGRKRVSGSLILGCRWRAMLVLCGIWAMRGWCCGLVRTLGRMRDLGLGQGDRRWRTSECCL